jgi:hypothetical protein
MDQRHEWEKGKVGRSDERSMSHIGEANTPYILVFIDVKGSNSVSLHESRDPGVVQKLSKP